MTILPREERLDNCIEWLTDLLESNFEQVEGRLARGDSRCCLGVGNQVANQAIYQLKHGTRKGLPYGGEEVNFGLFDVNAQIFGNCLYTYNDAGYTHREIGKMIMQNPKEVISPDIVEDVINYFTFGEY